MAQSSVIELWRLASSMSAGSAPLPPGRAASSTSTTRAPARAAESAADSPDGPAPITSTSQKP